MTSRWLANTMKKLKKRLAIRVSESRLNKLRALAEQLEKTMTQLVEDWIDSLEAPDSENETK